MKLDSKTVGELELPSGKVDVIHFDDALPGFGYRLRMSGGSVRKSWVAQYRQHGATRRVLVGSADVLTSEQARTAAKRILAQAALGEDPQAKKSERRAQTKFTFATVADDYLAVKQPTVRSATYVENRRYLTGPYFKSLHSTPIDRIERRDVATCLLAIGRDCGTVTAARARSAVASLFAWTMGEGLCENNPTIGTNRPKAPPARSRVLDDGELAAVWRACGDDNFGRVVKLLMLTGQRRTEVGGMTWTELSDGVWTIPGDRTKNHRTHVLPLSGLAQSIIEATPRIVGCDHLFGEKGFTSWGGSKAALDKRLGAKVKPWTIHDLRRTAATRMADIGIAPHVVEEVLNHQSGHRGGIAGVYNHSRYEREVRAAVALWADHVRSITSGGGRKVVVFTESASRIANA
jgi:integrase